MKERKKMKWSLVSVISLIFLLQFAAYALADDVGARLAAQFLKKTAITEIDPGMTMEQGLKAQSQFVAYLAKQLGEPVGYKAGLTNPAAQKAFGITQPVRGTLLRKMLLKNGATLEKNPGIRMFAEGDLIVRVGSDKINEAKTKEDALKFLDAVVPFLELPDIPFAANVKITGPALVAINVGARFGVMGDPIPLTTPAGWSDRLTNFTVQLYDEKGAVFSEGKGAALLGDPLNVVLWIRDSLAAEGKRLKKGDLLSLGSITKMMPAKPGTTVKAKFTGLDPKGAVEISASFK